MIVVTVTNKMANRSERDGDGEDAAQLACPVDRRGLAILARDPLQGGQEDDHVQSGGAPDRDERHRKLGDERIAEPGNRPKIDQRQQVVEQAELAVERDSPR